MEDQSNATESVSASTAVAAVLRERIVRGELIPGTPLREVVLADELDISRNTLREALGQLSSENLIEVRRHRGAVVKAMTSDDVRDVYNVRRALELHAVDRADLTNTENLELLNNRVAQAVEAGKLGDWRDVATKSLRFHQELVATLGSPRIDVFFGSVVAQIRLAFASVPDESGFQGAFIDRDREICDLLVAGSRAAAAASLRRYLDDAEQAVIDLPRG